MYVPEELACGIMVVQRWCRDSLQYAWSASGESGGFGCQLLTDEAFSSIVDQTESIFLIIGRFNICNPLLWHFSEVVKKASKGRVISLILSSRFVVRLTEVVDFNIKKIISFFVFVCLLWFVFFKETFTVFHLSTVINISAEAITGRCLY